MHTKKILTAGRSLTEASKALIMVHGRGGSAEDILSLSEYLSVGDYALVAPQATNNTWYPYSFLSPPAANEPWLSSALNVLEETVGEVEAKGIAQKDIFLLGFSQGACLTLEFVTRNAAKYGGVVAFTGGLIGDQLYTENYQGDFSGTPVFISTGDPDPHVPVARVTASASVLANLHAAVTTRIFPGRPHTISREEIEEVNKLILL